MIIFNHLRRQDMDQIVQIQLGRVIGRLAAQDVQLVVTPEARSFLGSQGYDPDYGARPLKRTIQRLVLDPLSEELLAGRIGKHERVEVILRGGALAFVRGDAPPVFLEKA